MSRRIAKRSCSRRQLIRRNVCGGEALEHRHMFAGVFSQVTDRVREVDRFLVDQQLFKLRKPFEFSRCGDYPLQRRK